MVKVAQTFIFKGRLQEYNLFLTERQIQGDVFVTNQLLNKTGERVEIITTMFSETTLPEIVNDRNAKPVEKKLSGVVSLN